MTTDARGAASTWGRAALGRTMLVLLVLGVLSAAFAALVAGSQAALGVAAGLGVASVTLATGFVVVDLIAGLKPSASLLIAMLTFLLQVVLLGALLAAAARADDLETVVDRGWTAAGVLLAALAWTVTLVHHALRAGPASEEVSPEARETVPRGVADPAEGGPR
jgi:ATP synthase protein I